jgi:hypothetical protein
MRIIPGLAAAALLLSGCAAAQAETLPNVVNDAATADPLTRDPLRVTRSVERKPIAVKVVKAKPAATPKPRKAAPAPVRGALSPRELLAVLRTAGFRGEGLRLAWAIAMRESHGRPSAHNRNAATGDNSYGLFQINMIGSLGVARAQKYGLSSYSALLDPRVNARVAFRMSGGGKNFGAWGVGSDSYAGAPSASSLNKWLAVYPG